ncbi:Ger(x)C family spore germination protein [Paenibacillus sp. URB8-2]|uniref:Ger(x)C family spore germination protein n=1 Tax=Paenibacillus sp. URB8-2 TaxID=2741301 RepID=UPI0015C0DBF3|nr:Ger(x)C family spore germination protein [Paenibacillus sp. URB8-2]BCG61599.1 germination protein [Paenibacillus sp. URB8-2]
MRKLGIMLLILAMLPTSGCWGRVELNDLSIVTASAIDKMEDGKYLLTLQIAVPTMLGPASGSGSGGSGSGDGNKATVVVSEKGVTMLDACRRLQKKLPRQLFFSHSRIIIIGEQLAREGVAPVLDFFVRYRESRLRSYILFSEGKAAEILKFNAKWEKISAEEIREEEKRHVAIRIYLKDFFQMLLTDGIEPIAAQVALRQTEIDNEEGSSGGDMNTVISGSAVFRKDKLVGWLDDAETRGALWLRNELKTSVVTVEISKDKGGGNISAMAVRKATKIKPILRDRKLRIQGDIYMENTVYENNSSLDMSDPKIIQYVEQELELETKRRIQSTIEKAQKTFNSDIFGFGNAVYRAYPKAWNRQFKESWDDVFPELEVDIKPHAKVVRTGLTNKSMITVEEGEE